MARKKGRKSHPVHTPDHSGDNRIVIRREDLPKERGVPIPAGRRFHNRNYDVRRGSRRHPKHKGRRDY